MKLPGKGHERKAQPSRGTERKKKLGTNSDKKQREQLKNDVQRGTATKGPHWNGKQKRLLGSLTHLCLVDSSTITVWTGLFPIAGYLVIFHYDYGL